MLDSTLKFYTTSRLRALSFSPREKQILELLYKGHSYKSIAKVLGITPKTVNAYCEKLYAKFNCHSKSEAIYHAIKLNIIVVN